MKSCVSWILIVGLLVACSGCIWWVPDEDRGRGRGEGRHGDGYRRGGEEHERHEGGRY